ncbi:zinc-binding dehydrogenase [Streptomyces sp. NPDC047043]|uniref:zinc-binding dehydrogenase n=1 Tax=Streptomyces sp. NPDC047043 TaxID=3154497 RepID=UPI0033F34C85
MPRPARSATVRWVESTGGDPLHRGPSVHGIALGAARSRGDERARAELPMRLAELMTLVASGRLGPMSPRTVTLADVPAALTEWAARHARGRLVLTYP